MTKNEHIKYWIDAAEVDRSAMDNLFKSKDYVWSLFLEHLIIEKLI
ncbi:MAG TPA: HEPN domain-containing protein [Ignavibacteria bacterium]|nr:HEPN domain-containing protein [Ignavibacteria bacterium]